MLDVDNAAPFLLREGLIDVGSILDGELIVSCRRPAKPQSAFKSGTTSAFLSNSPVIPPREGMQLSATRLRFTRSATPSRPPCHAGDSPSARLL